LLPNPPPNNKPATKDCATGAIDVAHTLAASRAQQAAQDLDILLNLAGINDEQQREQAHAAFALAFPISYRLWRSRSGNQSSTVPK